MKKFYKETSLDAYDPIFDSEFILKSFIRINIPGISAKYFYLDEKGINPAFQRIEEVNRLKKNEKKIFALRSDFILATGVKNAERHLGYRGLEEAFDETSQKYLNWHDRYGHPSIVAIDDSCDGKVFYAGFVCQREGYLEVFLSSGRYNRYQREEDGIFPLTKEQQFIIEAYLAKKFQKAYGIQNVVFYGTTPEEDAVDSALFFTDKPFSNEKIPRLYNQKVISEATNLAYSLTNFDDAKAFIQSNISIVEPKYTYEGELSINPGYQDVGSIEHLLRLNEKRIWALRSDFILALGIKNAYENEYGYTGFRECFSHSVYSYIDWQDRYGHTSLTTPSGDGAAYYAGYVCQKTGYLQVYLVSGRYERSDLSTHQTKILEAYIAAQFIAAYGIQDIEFVVGDSNIPTYHATFFKNKPFESDIPKRRYSLDDIREILKNVPGDLIETEEDTIKRLDSFG